MEQPSNKPVEPGEPQNNPHSKPTIAPPWQNWTVWEGQARFDGEDRPAEVGAVSADLPPNTSETGDIHNTGDDAGGDGAVIDGQVIESGQEQAGRDWSDANVFDANDRADVEHTDRAPHATGFDPGRPTHGRPTHGRPIEDRIDEVLIGRMGARRITVEPGDAAAFSVSLLNNGTEAVDFVLQVEGWVDEAWFPDLPQELHLEPGVWKTVSLAITPPRDASSEAGAHAFALTIRSPQLPERLTRLGAVLEIEPFHGFQLSPMEPDLVVYDRQMRGAATRVRVTNLGNHSTAFRVWAGRPPAMREKEPWDFAFRVGGERAWAHDSLRFMVEPGQTRTIACRVRIGGMPPLGPFARITPFRLAVDPVDVSRSKGGAPPVDRRVAEPNAGDEFETAFEHTPFEPTGFEHTVSGHTASNHAVSNHAVSNHAELMDRQIVAGQLEQPPLIGMWGLAGVFALLAAVVIFVSGASAIALASLQNRPMPSRNVQSEQPVVAIMLHMQEPVAQRAGSEVAGSALGSMAGPSVQRAIAPGSAVPIVGVGDVTTPDAAGQAPSSPALPPGFTPGESQADGSISADDAPLPSVSLQDVTAPGTQAGQGAALPAIEPQPNASGIDQGQSPEAQTRPQMTYAQMFQDVGLRYDLDWRMLAAQAYVESGFDSLALGGRGSMGLMQIQPQTWREWAPTIAAVDPFDSYSSALVAGIYLDYLRNLLATRGYPQTEWMLVAYNWGPDRLLGFLERGGDWAGLPAEVRNYAEDVLRIANTIPVSN